MLNRCFLIPINILKLPSHMQLSHLKQILGLVSKILGLAFSCLQKSILHRVSFRKAKARPSWILNPMLQELWVFLLWLKGFSIFFLALLNVKHGSLILLNTSFTASGSFLKWKHWSVHCGILSWDDVRVSRLFLCVVLSFLVLSYKLWPAFPLDLSFHFFKTGFSCVSHPWTVTWKFSHGNKLGHIQGSPHFFFHLSGITFFGCLMPNTLTWYFCCYCFTQDGNLILVTPSDLKLKPQLILTKEMGNRKIKKLYA